METEEVPSTVQDAPTARVHVPRLRWPAVPPDLALPEGLSREGQAAWEAIVTVLQAHDCTFTGGGTAFYSPAAWRRRGEEYGLNSLLIVVYDGGDVRDGFDPYERPGQVHSDVVAALRGLGLYFECCTHWYSSVHHL